MKRNILSVILAAATLSVAAQTAITPHVYTINAPQKQGEVVEGNLKMGGTSPTGGSISVNNLYVSIDGKPSIPVMGEFHYSRFPAEQWEQEILKMKAGGISVLPSYVFWNLHEEREGEWNWSGQLNLRRFVELCGKHNMKVIVRIGPFGHGEIRNGGLPDWLFAKPLELRSNHPLYLHYVEKFYQQIGQQLKGLYYKDGGPIIGCQIENEMQHSAAPWALTYPGAPKDHTVATSDAGTTKIGVSVQEKKLTHREQGEAHMRTLKQLAEQAGIVTPIYTVTGWGNAAVLDNEAIPVTAAYTYPTWAPRRMSPFCLFKDIHAHPDYEPVRYNPTDFPSFAAEMGVGIQMTYDRRPLIPHHAGEALMIRSLGSGANGIGYYMYHGGVTPHQQGGVGMMSDEPMGVPKMSYDFQAPLGEMGLEGKSYRELRLLHLFVNDFGHLLAPMQTVLPDGWDQIKPQDRETLRYAVRMKDGAGFVFMTNFQDHDTARHDMKDIALRLNLGQETLCIPSAGGFTLPKDENLILPFNLPLEEGTDVATLKYATAQLMTKLNDRGTDHYFFFVPDGMQAEYVFAGVKGRQKYQAVAGLKSTFTVTTRHGKRVKVTTLTRDMALNASKEDGRLLITEATAVPQDDGTVRLLQMGKSKFDYILYPSKQGFKAQTATVAEAVPQFKVERVGGRRVSVHVESDARQDSQVEEYFLKLDYTGDVALAFLHNELVLDHFWQGEPWMIGLNRYVDLLKANDLMIYMRPLNENAPYLGDLPVSAIPTFSKGKAQKVNEVIVVPQYRYTLTLPQ